MDRRRHSRGDQPVAGHDRQSLLARRGDDQTSRPGSRGGLARQGRGGDQDVLASAAPGARHRLASKALNHAAGLVTAGMRRLAETSIPIFPRPSGCATAPRYGLAIVGRLIDWRTYRIASESAAFSITQIQAQVSSRSRLGPSSRYRPMRDLPAVSGRDRREGSACLATRRTADYAAASCRPRRAAAFSRPDASS